MLILNSTEIEYCQIIEGESDFQKNYPGALYRGLIFTKKASYEHNQKEKAFAVCRHFLEEKNPLLTILVKEEKQISLWSEFGRLNSENLDLKLSCQLQNIEVLKSTSISIDDANKLVPPAIILLGVLIL